MLEWFTSPPAASPNWRGGVENGVFKPLPKALGRGWGVGIIFTSLWYRLFRAQFDQQPFHLFNFGGLCINNPLCKGRQFFMDGLFHNPSRHM